MTTLDLAPPAAPRFSLRRLALAAEPYLYCAPALILIAAIMLVPLAVGLSYAFRDLVLLDPLSGDYVGLDHFREVWADANFWNALENTVVWTVVSVALQFGLGLVLALLLNQPCPGRGLIQALVFLPWAVPSSSPGSTGPGCSTPSSAPCPTCSSGSG